MLTCALPNFDSEDLVSFRTPAKSWTLFPVCVIAALLLLCSLVFKLQTLMIFSRKQTKHYNKILETAPRLVVAGKQIRYESETVRYLGIWLDRNLSWRHHMRIKGQKVRNLLSKIQGASGRLWGLKPFLATRRISQFVEILFMRKISSDTKSL